ncbi:hypothetical protein [Psychrobacter sp. P11G5]|uniref:hypothetical protein n=1 Tax=Psychrobacter sp. P11G5 TaxID=1699624 RepID=UPI00078E02FC|nr:hypothetical protein [Psychrobacter sp. P11G5]AMN67767.1 hypothetical protein AK825_08680 [Psychrobacter sp. P11G5]
MIVAAVLNDSSHNQNANWVVTMRKLSKKQSQWAWFIGLYLAGFLVIFTIAQLIKLAMGV